MRGGRTAFFSLAFISCSFLFHRQMQISSGDKINYDMIREAIGTVVYDGCYEYVVTDYSFNYNTMELWCKTRQIFVKVTPKTFDSMMCISGTI